MNSVLFNVFSYYLIFEQAGVQATIFEVSEETNKGCDVQIVPLSLRGSLASTSSCVMGQQISSYVQFKGA